MGLEAISKTRFGTVIWAARSLNRCIPVIKKVIERGIFDLSMSNSFTFELVVTGIFDLHRIWQSTSHWKPTTQVVGSRSFLANSLISDGLRWKHWHVWKLMRQHLVTYASTGMHSFMKSMQSSTIPRILFLMTPRKKYMVFSISAMMNFLVKAAFLLLLNCTMLAHIWTQVR